MQSLGYFSRQWSIMCLLCIIPIFPSIKVVPTRNEMIKQLISIEEEEENGFLYNQGSIFPLILVLGHNTVWKRQPKDLNDTKEKCNVV